MRRALLIVIMLAMSLFVSAGLAEEYGGPVNPERALVESHSAIPSRPLTLLYSNAQVSARDSGAVTWSVALSCEIGYDQCCTFTVTPSDGGTYSYEFYFGEYGSVFGSSWVVYRQRTSGSNTFTICPIVVPGKYRLLVNVYDANGTKNQVVCGPYTVAEDGDHPSLETVVGNIVAECSGATDFDTALNLHDWITNHAYYDNSLLYYGADGVLVRGFGTCDSYSKAYYLLLKAAGITVTRISSSNHAWDTIRLDGDWYQVDPTWDDPTWGTASANVPRSGYENHEYFCVTDDLMLESGHSYDVSLSEPCESLACNYYVVRGGWQNEWDVDFLDEIRDRLNMGCLGVGVSCPKGTYTTKRHMTILCYILNTQPQWMEDVSAESLCFRYSYVDSAYAAWVEHAGNVSGNWLYVMTDNGASVLGYLGAAVSVSVPSTLGGTAVTALGDYALCCDTPLIALSLPDSVTSIGCYALFGCDSLEDCTLPDDVIHVGENALPTGIAASCGADTLTSHTLGEAGYAFCDPDLPDWTLLWRDDEVLSVESYLGVDIRAALPEAVTGLGRLDAGSLSVLEISGDIGWAYTDDSCVSAPMLVLCDAPSQSLSDWCQANDAVLAGAFNRWELPASLTEIGEEALRGSARGWVVIPDTCGIIGDLAFADCPGLQLVTVPGTTVAIGDGAFDSGVILLTPDESPAAAWADAHGVAHVAP